MDYLLLIVLIIILIVIVISWFLIPRVSLLPPTVPGEWKVSGSSDPSRNTCQLYEFPISQRYQGRFVFPSPSLSNLDLIAPETPSISCVKSNQIIAQQVVRTCTRQGCIDRNGNSVPVGTQETYYLECNFLDSCPGSDSLLSINYNSPTPVCITNQGGNAIMTPCDPTDSRQVMSIVRTGLGQDPATLTGKGGLTGPIGQIKNNELCLMKSSNSGTSSSNCPGNINRNGSLLIFGQCDDSTWGFTPSLPQCPAGKNQFDICCDSTGPDCPGGVPTGAQARIIPCCKNSPPQLVFDSQSLYYGGQGQLILTQPATDDSSCEGRNYVARNLTLATYANSLATPPCITGQTSCSPF